MHLGVMLCSVLNNLLDDQPVTIYLLDGGIEKDNKLKIGRIIHEHGTKSTRSEWIDPGAGSWSTLETTSGYITSATYLRLFIPEYLPQTVKKALYIDADAIVERNLEEVWSFDVSEWAAGAVQDQVLPYASSKEGIPKYQEYGLEPRTKCFNAGVLLINLDHWRDNQVSKKVLQYLNSFDGPVRLQDQDGLNVVLADKWKELPWRWNVGAVRVPKFERWEEADLRKKYNDEVSVVRKNPGIVHFVGPGKPWHFGQRDYPWGERYYYYLDESRWIENRADWLRWRASEFQKYIERWFTGTLNQVRRKLRRIVPSPETRKWIRSLAGEKS
jgi:lipopolysaccharide biosynthesis glycosyltransferase